MTVINILNLCNFINEDWYSFLLDEMHKDYFHNLLKFINIEYINNIVYPPQPLIFNAFNSCRLDKISVVILGQDPYHGENQANGLAFSVTNNKPPPSLRNIINEVIADTGNNDINNDKNNNSLVCDLNNGNLEYWANQGVLLLNNVLTVQKGIAHSHKNKGWEEFTTAVINKLNNNTNHLVFILWGRPAQKKGSIIDTTKHLVIKSSHPSPLGFTKTSQPFKGSNCFSRANQYLAEHNKPTINWISHINI